MRRHFLVVPHLGYWGLTVVRAPELGKWHQRGESQLAVGVLLLTQGMDGDEGTGL